MKKFLSSLAAIWLFAAMVGLQPLEAQSFATPAAGEAQGFNSQTLVFELSLFLPQDALGKAFGAGTRGSLGRGSPGGAAGGAGAFGAAGGATSAGGGAGAQQGRDPQRTSPRFDRDPKLFLTKDQVDRLLPILKALRDNPMPSPSKARQIGADMETIITKAQKAEYEEWRKAMDRYRQELRQRFAASGGQGGLAQGGGAPGQAGGGASGQAGAAPGQAGARGPADASAPKTNELQRRQRLLDSFMTALAEYRKGL